MGKSNTFINDLIAFIFQNTALPAGYNGPFYLALHTADPGASGSATTSEATYTGYARQSLARSSSGFDVASQQSKNHSAITFPACTAGSNTITYFSVVTTSSGAGTILYSGALTASLAVSAGITPTVAANAIVITEA
jgi:hypothetical protein